MLSPADILQGKILIVDDQEANVAVLEQMLRGAGYGAVTSTQDPRTVCDLHRQNRYDLILLDLQMPGMDGFEVMTGLKEIELGTYLPVLVLTAQPGHKLRALKAGAKDFVSKPFDLPEVLARVHNLLEVRLLHQNENTVNAARLETTQRIVGLGDWDYDAVTDRLVWSEEVYRILGVPRTNAPLSSDQFYRQVHPDDLAFVHREKQLAAAGSRRANFEHRLIRADGELRYIHQIMEVELDREGRIVHEFGTVHDITNRCLADESLRQNEERYRTLLMVSPDANFVYVDNVITLVNHAFCKMMGASDAAQLIGQPALGVTHPDYHDVIRARRLRHADREPPAPSEVKFLRLDGATIDVEVSSVAFQIHGRQEVQVISRDITARKQAEKDLRESEERFKFVAHAVSDVIWDWNVATGVLWWDDGVLTTFGFSAGDVEHTVAGWRSRIHGDDRTRIADSVRAALDSKQETWTAEYRFQRKDGTYAAVQDRGYILRDVAGLGFRMVGGVRDLTEQKAMEAQVLRAQRMESIGALASGIAHDLNNVLAPIMMAIELLRRDSIDDPRRTKILETIRTSGQRGADLVRQVLSFARGIDEQKVAIGLKHLINELECIISQTFPRNIRISTEVAMNLRTVTGDPTQLHQVLLNLLVNARDAMPDGGALVIRASNLTLNADTSPGASTSEARVGPYVLLEVSDTGHGIPPEVRDRIFDAFFTTKEVGKGTGFGLSTVQTVVRGHGGFVTVESTVGQGTTFKIHLPANLATTTGPTLHPFQVNLPAGHDECVLVVDDEFSIRDITQQTLEAFGYRVLIASNGAEAVALYARQAKEINLVVTDVMMPAMDGAEMIQMILRLNPAAKIIAVSGIDSDQGGRKAAKAGAQHFLLKPYTAGTLLKLVREVLDRPAVPLPR